ncbi:CDP-glucose 4,6-dehydratase [Sphingomonas antarctica]|uniref:CDP-glucose 4,6-dehydratase n=1 Tax=Sphingomonas antarctica TaxID=2040274 RepID=UPI0039EB7EA0
MVRPVWDGRRVLITGDTGFKGSWLSLWLADLGALVAGFALPAATDPSLFESARIGDLVEHTDGDIRDLDAVERVVQQTAPEVVFHLAAQPLVRYSYQAPIETYATNVMGTAHVLDACRRQSSVKAIIVVTTDKCYENREWVWPYRESDPLGGHDPYSSSKGAAELVASAYRRSYFGVDGAPLLATVRAGNVIGGGDWSTDRLIPDFVRAFERGERVRIRSPRAVRPWQHVLEALDGYLTIAARLLKGDRAVATAWNFGPDQEDARSVSWIATRMVELFGAGGWDQDEAPQAHEATMLMLDCSKARQELGWRPAWPVAKALERVVAWHRGAADGGDARALTLNQIKEYQALGRALAGEYL